MTLSPLQQQAVEAVRAYDESVSICKSASIGTPAHDAFFAESGRLQRKAGKACIAAIRELADNEGETNHG